MIEEAPSLTQGMVQEDHATLQQLGKEISPSSNFVTNFDRNADIGQCFPVDVNATFLQPVLGNSGYKTSYFPLEQPHRRPPFPVTQAHFQKAKPAKVTFQAEDVNVTNPSACLNGLGPSLVDELGSNEVPAYHANLGCSPPLQAATNLDLAPEASGSCQSTFNTLSQRLTSSLTSWIVGNTIAVQRAAQTIPNMSVV